MSRNATPANLTVLVPKPLGVYIRQSKPLTRLWFEKNGGPEVREEMKAIARKRRRFGYRRIGVLLERKGMIMTHEKLYRFYTEAKLVT